MTDFGGRDVGEGALQEGQMAMKKAYSTDPGQDNVGCLPSGLTRSVTQASRFYQNPVEAVPPHMSPQLQRLPELSEIPPNSSSTGPYSLNFQLSNVSNDNHPDLTDHLQHTVSNNSYTQPSCLRSIQGKMTVSGANSTGKMIAERTGQSEEKSCNKCQSIRKRYVQKRVPIRKAPKPIVDPAPLRKRTAPINPAYTVRKSRIPIGMHLRPYRDRVIHLLALKDYKKSELLIRLQKDGIKEKDKNSLANILHEVANLNSQNCSYSLKDCVFTEIQRDWPGYSDIERQALELVFSNKVGPFNKPESPLDCCRDITSSPKDQLLNSFVDDDFMISEISMPYLTTVVQPISHSPLNINSEHSADTSKDILLPVSPTYLPTSNPPLPVNSNCNTCSTQKNLGTQDLYVHRNFQDSSIFQSQPNKHISSENSSSLSIQSKHLTTAKGKYLLSEEESTYKFTEHEANNQNYNIDILMKTGKADSARQEEKARKNSSKNLQKDDATSGKTPSPSGLPDYLSNYVTIVSSEQCHHYDQEFRANYNEYHTLYCKILNLSESINDLEFKRSLFPPGSQEYQDISEKLSVERQKIEQANPNWSEENHRCSYLYNKLTHIKKLIKAFDKRQGN